MGLQVNIRIRTRLSPDTSTTNKKDFNTQAFMPEQTD